MTGLHWRRKLSIFLNDTTLNDWLTAESTEVAQRLIGATLLVDGVGGMVVETEAYRHDDPASHSFAGLTRRNRAMFGPVGAAYVYKIYGIHWCLNLVCGPKPGSAVLIRALEPRQGIDLMCERRGRSDLKALCSGPGKLAQALGIAGLIDGKDFHQPPLSLVLPTALAPIVAGRRIGITRGTDLNWRFGMRGSAFLSRPFAVSQSDGVGTG